MNDPRTHRVPTPRRLKRQLGFTLMEVLGAIAILGISFTLLATSSIRGLRMIGESTRRSEASLLADRLLAEIELKAEVGELIEIGSEEPDEDPFTVVVEVRDLAEEYPGSSTDPDSQDLLEFLAAEANGPFAEFRDSNWLLGYLREIYISIEWQEGAKEISVSRTAYVYDQQAWLENEQNQADAEENSNENGDENGNRS